MLELCLISKNCYFVYHKMCKMPLGIVARSRCARCSCVLIFAIVYAKKPAKQKIPLVHNMESFVSMQLQLRPHISPYVKMTRMTIQACVTIQACDFSMLGHIFLTLPTHELRRLQYLVRVCVYP